MIDEQEVHLILKSDNFKQYLKFIEECKVLATEDLQGEIHHIIPRCMYETNDKNNLILLSYQNHYYAHKLLAELFPNIFEFWSAWWLMCHVQNRVNELTADEFATLRENYRQRCSDYFSLHPNKSALNKKWYNNGEKEIQLSDIDLIPANFKLGRLPVTINTCLKRSENASKYHWYTNGIDESFSEQCPEGFYSGRAPVGKWYNNGINEIQLKNNQSIPDTYIPGRLKWSDDRKLSISGVNNPNFGKKFPQQTRDKMSKSKMGKSTIQEDTGIIMGLLNVQ